MKNIVGQAITTAALFGLIGPAIGALLANLYLAWPFSGPLSGYFSGGMLLIALMSLFFGYAAGVVPAAITGATYGIVVVHYFPNRRLSYPLITFLSGAIGYCATFLSLFLYFGVSTTSPRF